MSLRGRWRLAYARWHTARAHSRVVHGMPLLVAPGVFDPVLTKVGAWLAGEAGQLVRPGERWLEVGTGTGVVSLAMARAGAEVVAVDIDPAAVANARFNSALNGLAVDVREGDLFDPVAREPRLAHGRAFHGVVANLPFWPGTGKGLPVGHAFGAGEDYALLRKFSAEALNHAPTAYVVLSEAFAGHREARAALGTHAVLHQRAHHRGEWLALYRFGRPSPGFL